MVRFILLFLLALLVLRALLRVFRGVLDGAGYRREGGGTPSVKLVRDPVCGMFLVPSKALTAEARGETQYFCSEKCRAEWRRAQA
jgi:YHS domain-containing protein